MLGNVTKPVDAIGQIHHAVQSFCRDVVCPITLCTHVGLPCIGKVACQLGELLAFAIPVLLDVGPCFFLSLHRRRE